MSPAEAGKPALDDQSMQQSPFIYYLHTHSGTFWLVVLAFLKAFVWPAFVVLPRAANSHMIGWRQTVLGLPL